MHKLKVPTKPPGSRAQRSSSIKILQHEPQPTHTRTKIANSTSSRRNASSSRSELSYYNNNNRSNKNKSMLGMEGLGFCCSGHGNRFKRVSELEKTDTLRSKPHRLELQEMEEKKTEKTIKMKNTKVSNKERVAVSQSMLDQSSTKLKKQKKNSAYKPTKQPKKSKKPSQKHKNSQNTLAYSSLEKPKVKQYPYSDYNQQLRLHEINPFDISQGRRKRILQARKNQEKVSIDPSQYLIREPTGVYKDSSNNTKSLETVSEKHETQSKQHGRSSKSRIIVQQQQLLGSTEPKLATLGLTQLDLRAILNSELTLKKQLQQYQQDTITQLKTTNTNLQHQLAQACTKYQNAIELKSKQIFLIRQENAKELATAKRNCEEIKEKCKEIRVEKERLVGKLEEELRGERKGAAEERESLLRKIRTIQQKEQKLMTKVSQIQQQNLNLKSQLTRLQTQKQKYQRTLKKCQTQLQTLQSKLQIEVRKNKQQYKQIQILKKEKEYIKENSRLVLEIVRNQMKGLKDEVDDEKGENARGEEAKPNKEKYLFSISPKKRRVLEQNNIDINTLTTQ